MLSPSMEMSCHVVAADTLYDNAICEKTSKLVSLQLAIGTQMTRIKQITTDLMWVQPL